MARKRKGRPVHGWLIVDKPLGVTSTQIVGRVRRALDAQKIGHGGTLDPLATGVLPLALGEATKTVSYAMDGRKTYRFEVCWGEATSTDDREGEVTETSDHRPERAEIEAALADFHGTIAQIPPRFSAIKLQGERAYDLARENREFELAARPVEIERFVLCDSDRDTFNPDLASFEVDCGKGTYVRSLARDLARKLGTVGHVSALRRTSVGPFHENDAISLESLEALGHSPAALELLLPVETALDDIPALALSETEAARLRSGQSVSMLARSRSDQVRMLNSGSIVFAKTGDTPVALARYEAGDIHPVRVLNL
ncbi:tRNA pseudouridine(55) synthase TruB [Pelagibius sp. Alg239-R121]|uniref:tRNA pseudouridine(55) synthase TruB n=1 Tax=Pelagibius sp. Alg239-R121 TaxID=2993448 RepID=UPI0024A748B0|nr:tRNA pseudouridine(55) synthase TruB [Pelagibius sp. Alg239-R121]